MAGSHDNSRLIGEIARRVGAFDLEAQRILSRHEDADARVLTLESTYGTLEGLSLTQDEVFREALRAVEQSLFRAAHVLAFAAFVDWLHVWLWAGHRTAMQAQYPKWNLHDSQDFREHADYQVIEAERRSGPTTRT